MDAGNDAEPSEVKIATLESGWPGLVGVDHHVIGKRGLSANMYM